ncbi:SRPBCC domain-containing protein [Sinomonas mesophila]|uniref:SRPBCC domain-containing protein n=1 Tax=Sinomonas mesophila TaxID=1531955 RepID=UPI00098570FE|nr:SRPBCC domain-containing protein [Sinomonas mesophila]
MAEIDELDGQYAEVEGRGAVTFIRSYPVPAAEAWAAVSTAEGLEGWFPSRVRIDHDAGIVAFGGDPNLESSAERIVDWEPPRRWAFEWGGDLMEFLVEGSDAEAELTLRNWLADTRTAARNAAGWHVCLAELARKLGRPEGPHDGGAGSGPDWDQLYEGYVAAGLPSGAPIPGREG